MFPVERSSCVPGSSSSSSRRVAAVRVCASKRLQPSPQGGHHTVLRSVVLRTADIAIDLIERYLYEIGYLHMRLSRLGRLGGIVCVYYLSAYE